MNKMSKESIELSDKDLAAVSGGVVRMPPVTVIVFTEGSVIHGKPKK
jgi:bacteriocin-like protein